MGWRKEWRIEHCLEQKSGLLIYRRVHGYAHTRPGDLKIVFTA